MFSGVSALVYLGRKPEAIAEGINAPRWRAGRRDVYLRSCVLHELERMYPFFEAS